MARRKLSPEEKTAHEAEQALHDKRRSEVWTLEDDVIRETRLAAIKSVLPDYEPKTHTDEDDDGNEITYQIVKIDNLPKWLGDIVEEVEGGHRFRDEKGCDGLANNAADEAAAEAGHAAWLKTYDAKYRETFAARFEEAIAKHEDRWDYVNNCVEQPNVVPLRTAS
jgi:hypothetical protein